MKYPLLIVAICFLNVCFAQDSKELLEKADSYYERADYKGSYGLYKQVKSAEETGSPEYRYAADRMAMIFYQERFKDLDNKEYNKALSYYTYFLEFVENEQEHISAYWNKERKYELIQTIIQLHFKLETYAEIEYYKNLLYAAYYKKELPVGLDEYFQFDEFEVLGTKVKGYEYYANIDDEGMGDSFHKLIYFVYKGDLTRGEEEELYQVQLLMMQRFHEYLPDFVLSKQNVNIEGELAQNLWNYTYKEPMDYLKIKQGVMDVISGKALSSPTARMRKD